LYKIPANTVFVGKKLVFMPECHSTNTVASELCHEIPPPPEGTVIITANQTAGRGQRGNTWFVESGKNFTFSVVFYPNFLPIDSQFYLNMVASLAVRDYLLRIGCAAVSVKWPNDVFLTNRKVSGILIESIVSGTALARSIIGVGLNMNQQFPDAAHAISVSQFVAKQLVLDDQLPLLLESLESRYLQLKENAYSALRSDYLESLYWRDEPHVFRSNGSQFEGRIEGIDDNGQLIISTCTGKRSFGVREITYEH
jgi:BirA family biotin operon repressor/biotin-[acetyl-CoA-carboxylase] ligase